MMGFTNDADSQIRVVYYARYESEQQSRKDLSIVDQPKRMHMRIAAYIRARYPNNLRQQGELIEQQFREIANWVTANSHTLVKTVVSEGASVLDKRPELHALINELLADHHPYDAIVVCSTNRLYWDFRKLTQLNNKLSAVGVAIISLTQPLVDTKSSEILHKLFKRVITKFSAGEKKSRKNSPKDKSKHSASRRHK